MSDLVTKIEKAVAEWTRSFLNDPNNHSPIAAHIAAALTPSHEAGTQGGDGTKLKPYALPFHVDGGCIRDVNNGYVAELSSPHGGDARDRIAQFIVTAVNLRMSKAGTQEPVAWREINGKTPTDRFIIMWCREDDSYWWAKWQGGMWHGVDDLGLTRDSENFTPDLWREIPRADAAPASQDATRFVCPKCGTRGTTDGEASTIIGAENATQAIREALEAIRIYAADTLSGRTDGPDDRDWQREAVREIHRRALAALRSPARADRAVTADDSGEVG